MNQMKTLQSYQGNNTARRADEADVRKSHKLHKTEGLINPSENTLATFRGVEKEQLETERANVVQTSKLASLGEMSAGIAHEINQPLNVIQVCADFFLKMIARGQPISEEDLKSMAGDIGRNVQRAAAIIQHMRDFARQSGATRSKININDSKHCAI
jgi:C4-dicarboxylate-specific signal transduction histidine kinase